MPLERPSVVGAWGQRSETWVRGLGGVWTHELPEQLLISASGAKSQL